MEYLQFDLDSLDQSAPKNPAGKLLGTLKPIDNSPKEDTLVVRRQKQSILQAPRARLRGPLDAPAANLDAGAEIVFRGEASVALSIRSSIWHTRGSLRLGRHSHAEVSGADTLLDGPGYVGRGSWSRLGCASLGVICRDILCERIKQRVGCCDRRQATMPRVIDCLRPDLGLSPWTRGGRF